MLYNMRNAVMTLKMTGNKRKINIIEIVMTNNAINIWQKSMYTVMTLKMTGNKRKINIIEIVMTNKAINIWQKNVYKCLTSLHCCKINKIPSFR